MLNQKTEKVNNSEKNPSLTFYGSKLFVKCFAWFIFIALVNLALATAFVYIYHYKPTRQEFERIASTILVDKGQLMVETYEKQGTLSTTKFRGLGNFWLFNEKLEKLFDGSDLKDNESKHSDFPNEELAKMKSPKKPDMGFKPDSFMPRPPNEPFRPMPPNKGFFFKPNALYDINASFTSKHIHFGPERRPPMPEFPPKERIRPFDSFEKIENAIDIKPPQDKKLRKIYKKFYKDNNEKVIDFAKNLLGKTDTEVLNIGKEIFFGCQIISDNANKYVAIVHIPQEIPGQNNDIFINKAKNMLPLLLIVCAILCFLMARYLSKPIVELQEASRRFAKGDFSKKIIKNAMARYDEIGDLAVDFNNMAERIELGINSQKRLFHDISHELRSPLARMQVGIELLQLKVSESEKSLVERLGKDVTRMNALIEELLQFSKLENRQVGSANEDVDLGKALENVCEDAEFEGHNNHKGVRLEIKQDSIIKGNPALIERAFENIIRNGLRFTPENTVVEVRLEKIDNKAIIKIADQGSGVPEDQVEKIFAPFYCIKQDRNPQKGGIGLGLSIALRAIQLHKGNIKMSNRKEGGLLATIEIPLE